MTAARMATYATIGAVVAWAVKALVIGLAGGLDKSPAEGPLFFLGMILFTVGVVAIGLAITTGRSVGVRVLGVVGTVAVMFVVWLAIDTVIASMAPENDPHWVWAEAQLWVIAVVVALGWQFWLGRIGRGVPQDGLPA
ncbi:MAG: hypothetical protein ACRDOM_05325 [Nocardioides sp.]